MSSPGLIATESSLPISISARVPPKASNCIRAWSSTAGFISTQGVSSSTALKSKGGIVRPIKAEWRKYMLGLCIVLAMVLGGGTDGGLWTDSVLEAVILTATVSILADREG